MSEWKAMVEAIRADRIRLRAHVDREDRPGRSLIRQGLVAAILYRLSHYFYVRGWWLPARFTWLTNIVLSGADIDCAAVVGKGLVLPDTRQVIIYGNAGENCTFMGRSGLGGSFRRGRAVDGQEKPVLLDGVTVGFGAMIFGPVTIGRNVDVGPSYCVVKSLPDGAVVGWERQADRPCAGAASRSADRAVGRQSLRAALGADLERLRAFYTSATDAKTVAWLQSAFVAVVLYRVAHRMREIGLDLLAHLIWMINRIVTGADIDPAAEVGPGLLIPVPHNVICYARVGKNCTLHAQATVGMRWADTAHRGGASAGMPALGDDVEIGAGTIVIGPVRVGRGARIGARRLIVSDVGDHEQVPARRCRILRTDR